MTQQLPLFSEPDKPGKSEIRNSESEISEEDPIRAQWDQRLANFENWLRSLNKAKRTIQGYTTDIQQLLDFLEGEGRLNENIGTDDLVAFLAEQQKGGAKSRTLDRKRAAFKAFFGYLVRFKQITDDPSRQLGVPIADYELPLTLTEDEVEGLLEAANHHPRDFAILHLFVNCGLRISELCDLTLEHIDLKESILYVKGRFVPLPPNTKVALKAWLDQIEGDDIFTITPQAIRLLVKKYATAAGIRKTVRPSLLRHTFGVLSLMRGEDYETVKLTLGHEIDDVMQQYVQRAHQLQTLRHQRAESVEGVAGERG